MTVIIAIVTILLGLAATIDADLRWLFRPNKLSKPALARLQQATTKCAIDPDQQRLDDAVARLKEYIDGFADLTRANLLSSKLQGAGMTDQSTTKQAQSLVIAIAPLLRGFSPEVQSIVLADLTATWLCGFVGSDAAAAREELLTHHVALIRKLIPHNEQEVLDRWLPEGRG